MARNLVPLLILLAPNLVPAHASPVTKPLINLSQTPSNLTYYTIQNTTLSGRQECFPTSQGIDTNYCLQMLPSIDAVARDPHKPIRWGFQGDVDRQLPDQGEWSSVGCRIYISSLHPDLIGIFSPLEIEVKVRDLVASCGDRGGYNQVGTSETQYYVTTGPPKSRYGSVGSSINNSTLVMAGAATS